MLHLTSNSSFLIFFFSLFLFLYSFHSFPIRDGVKVDGDEQLNQGVMQNSTLKLAQIQTSRNDFFNHFEVYTGGWNISNSDYITSVLSTAVPIFAVAAIWLVLFGLVLQITCCCYCCFPKQSDGYYQPDCISLIFLILCTITVICGCVVLYSNEQEFQETTSDIIDYILSQVEFTVENLKNVSNSFDSAKTIAHELNLPPDADMGIDSVKKKILDAAINISNKSHDNSEIIYRVLDGVKLSLVLVGSTMIIVSVIGLFTSVLGLKCILYSLVVAGWIIVGGTFILSGGFVFLHNVIDDTCVAMNEWSENPTSHTALDEILPCVENQTSLETFLKSKSETYILVNSVNGLISKVLNDNTFPNNKSGPLVPLLCNPFNSDLTVRQCVVGEVGFENAIEVWKNYTCPVSGSDNYCSTTGRITPFIYNQLTTMVNVTYSLYHYGPFLVDLMDCTFVRKTFKDINNDYCPSLEKCTKWIYWGLFMVSGAVMLSLIFWISYERHPYHNHYYRRQF
ncbi:uncharacterized protein LOC131638897 [Vicia villosa]|uniref:uncharacterized protein LOC131638897 n=1 Tax=Vicia villosa TaxID=3911 RepID=UPI00273C36C2|nr:uncharacterized protein LOC131638897 [Vicia villosa]